MFRTLRILLLLTICFSILAPGGKDPYQIITRQSELDEIFKEVESFARSSLNLNLKKTVKASLASDKQLDELYRGPFKGLETGIYRLEGRTHILYLMSGQSRDATGGVLAHEYAHAWQQENCPLDQDTVIREGFAEWVQYKYFDQVGAYQLMTYMRNARKPVYGEGLKLMLEWEQKYGVKGLLEKVKAQKSQ